MAVGVSLLATALLLLMVNTSIGQNSPNLFIANPLESGSKNIIYNWKPSDKIREEFPWHTMGFDREGRVVFLNEFGKWNLRDVAENAGNDVDTFIRYFEQGLQMFADLSLVPQVHPNGTLYGPEGCASIVDMGTFNAYAIASPRIMTLILEVFTKVVNADEYLAYGFVINMPRLAMTALNAVRATLPGGLTKFQIFGSDENKYIPAILKRIPRDQLPPHLGGYDNFTFIAPFGQTFNLHMD